MVREQMYIAIPEEWKTRKVAGLCPVCGRTKEDFEPRRKVYCSSKCASKWADHYKSWSEVRDKMVFANSQCAKCGMTERLWVIQKNANIEEENKDLMKKYEKEIEAEKFRQIAKLEERFIREVKEIENWKISDWTLQHFLKDNFEEKFKDFYSIYFPGFEVDHVIAIMNGGSMWDEKNLQVLCKPCHRTKTKQDFKESKIDSKQKRLEK